MNKKVWLLGAAVAFSTAFTACKQSSTNVGTDGADSLAIESAEDLSVLKVDSVEYRRNWELSDPEIKEFVGDAYPGVTCVVDVPSFEQAPVLANAIMEWVNEMCVGGNYKGDLKDVSAMMDLYVQNLRSGEDGTGSDMQNEFSIRKIYENENVVTYMYQGYDYALGAAHGMNYTRGASFRKSDGKLFGWNMFSDKADLQPYLKQGLKAYFEVESDAELEENLMMDEMYSVNLLPKPDSDPWITEKGVEMVYQDYEIACYAAGQPDVIIKASDAENLLTPTAAKLLK